METIYLALVSTPGIFASIIRRVIKQDYIHVTLSFERSFTKAYTFGRRNPFIPISAGFTMEKSHQINRKFPGAKYRIVQVEVTQAQKAAIQAEMDALYRRRFFYHYTILGLPFVLLNRPFHQRNHYTCSSFMGDLFMRHGLVDFGKHFSLVTPKDFLELDYPIVFEGRFKDHR